jgi:EAL domain-containing protein (putative c-di-GMP-specific phosphodiesterase class I)
VTTIVEKINREFSELLEKNRIDEKILSISFGVYRYTSQVKLDELLTRTDNALLNAVAKEGTNIALYEDKDSKNALAKDAWHKIIKKAIDDESFKLKFWPILNSKTKTLDHKVMTFTIKSDNDKEYYFGDFIAPAINFGLVEELFTSVIKDILTHDYDELGHGVCSIRLSNEFIKDLHSLDSLSQLFAHYVKKQNHKLFFEIADSFAIKNEKLVKGFVNLFEQYGFGFAINSFTGESNDFNYLKELSPIYIKVDSRFLLDQSEESMSSLQVVVDSLGIEIVATSVNLLDEVENLSSKNIMLIQGSVTDLL